MIYDKQYDSVCVPSNLGGYSRQLTAYELSLGDVQYAGTAESGNKCVTRLWREHGIYHVRTHSFALHYRCAWETAKTLGIARKLFKAQVAAYVTVDKPNLSANGPYATKEDSQTAKELGITVRELRSQRASEDK